ncbi:hypothetical protein OF897_15380, partial [Chryseobacterium formosus]
YLVSTYSCVEQVDETLMPTDPGVGGGGGGGGPAGNGPDECTTVANNPGEVGIIDENGCHVGGATQPNDPNQQDERTPCEILKENSLDPAIQPKLDTLKKYVDPTNPKKHNHETGITITKRGEVLKYNVFDKPIDIGVAGAVTVEIVHHTWDILVAHNHYENTFPVQQFGDIHDLYVEYKKLAPPRKNTYVAYTVNFNGTEYAFRMNDTTALDAIFAGLNQGTTSTTDEDKVARGKIYKIFERYEFDKNKDYTEDEALKLLMKVLNDSEIGSADGVHLYRKDKTNNRWGKLKLKSNGEVDKDDCPL